jgi:ABC-2 type transport system permease protein
VTMYPTVSQMAPVDARLFQSFLEQQGSIMFFVTLWAGAGLIANDRQANALQIYLSKPLLRAEYIAGKLTVLVVFLMNVTLLPALLLVVMQIMFSGSLSFIRDNQFLLPALVVASIVRVGVSALTMLALSALSKSSRFVAVLYTGVLLFSEAVYGFLVVVTGSSRVAWVSISGNLEVVTDAIFRQPIRYDTPVTISVLVLLGLALVSISVLERRVRGVEVVK